MAIGEVRWFSPRKGFGFIRPEHGPCDVFVHVSAVEQAGLRGLTPGQRLEFELAQLGDGRLCAFGLRTVEQGEATGGECAGNACQMNGAAIA
jgi:CspA family cold shock protein